MPHAPLGDFANVKKLVVDVRVERP